MKKFILVLSIIIISCAPILDVKIQSVQKVVETTGSKNDLFVKANQWMVKTFNNAESVIQFSDKESGTITGKYMLKQTYSVGNNYQYVPNGGIFAVINIDIKDNKARITITPEDYRTPSQHNDPALIYKEETARADIHQLIQEFSKSITEDSNKDW